MDVSKLNEKLRTIQKQILEIQENCNHREKEIKFINYKEGTRWVCKKCSLPIGWPTEDERKKWSK